MPQFHALLKIKEKSKRTRNLDTRWDIRGKKKKYRKRKEKCSCSLKLSHGAPFLNYHPFPTMLPTPPTQDQWPSWGDPSWFSMRIQVVHLHIPARLKPELSLDLLAPEPTPGSLCVGRSSDHMQVCVRD